MTDEIKTPTLREVSQMSRDFGLVGERNTHLVTLLSTINGGLVIMKSPSRSGKDMVVDAVAFCRSGDDISEIPNSTSKTVLYQRANELNEANVHRYPDITSLEEHIETLLKMNGDGRPSSHEFTDVSGQERSTVKQTIEPPNSMILFAASDNNNIDLNDYPEVRNRALVISTDTSAGLTKKVKQRQADIEVGKYDSKLSQERHDEIRQYIGSIPVDLYTADSDVGEVWNMTHGGFAKENPLPDLFPESRMDFKRFNKFVKAVTLFHYGERMELNNAERDATVSLVATPEDLWLAWKIFGEKMVLSALNLDDKDFAVLELLRDSKQAKTVADVQADIRNQGQNLDDTQIRNSLKAMDHKGYLIRDDSGQRVKYQPSPFATPDNVSKDVSIDFETIVEQTKKDAEYMFTDDTAAEYISRYCEGEGLITTHPLEGGQVNITESDLGETVADQGEKEADTVTETNPFEDNTDHDPDDEPKIQGTIG